MSRATGPSTATRKRVYDRDHLVCVRCGVGHNGLTLQHRIARGMGGTRESWINQPANLLTLCGSGTTGCHGWVEAHPRVADAHGWSAPRHVDLTGWLVYTWQGWCALDHSGGVRKCRVPARGEQAAMLSGCDCGCRRATVCGEIGIFRG